ncbi:MAG: calcium-binding protein [Planctomycetota bacterium]|nr:calcium-binding protein [Planctomycetota bacterium]
MFRKPIGTRTSKGNRKSPRHISRRQANRNPQSPQMESCEERLLLSGTDPFGGPITTIIQTQYADVQNVLDSFDTKLFDAVLGHPLPLVGNALKNAKATADDLLNTLIGDVNGVFTILSGAATLTPNDIKNALAAITGVSGVVESDTVVAGSVTAAQFDTTISGTLINASFSPNFDVGLPGLGLTVNGTVNTTVTYTFLLNLGVDAGGFYIDTSPTGANPEFKISLDVTAPGLSATAGLLGFLQLEATDNPTTPSDFNVNFLVDVSDSDLDNKLSLPGDLSHVTFDATLSGDAGIHLKNHLTFNGSAVFPSLRADFDLTWHFGVGTVVDPGGSLAGFGDEPQIGFNNIQLDLGSFFSDFAAPIVGKIKSVLDPLQPVFDVLNVRMPVLSDIGFLRGLFDENSDGKVTLLETVDTLNPSPETKLLEAVNSVNDFISRIPSSSSVILDLGSFNLQDNGYDARGGAPLSGVSLTSFSANDVMGALNTLGVTDSDIQGFLDGLQLPGMDGTGGAVEGGGLHFPILEHPTSVFKVLLGQDVPIFTFDMPGLEASFHLDEFFPVLGPLGVQLLGDFDIKGHVAFGYDTHGLSEFAAGGFSNPGLVFDGFYVSTTDQPDGSFGVYTPLATVTASIGAYAALDIVVADFGVGGGIAANVNIEAADPDVSPGFPKGDGKLRLNEIIAGLEEGPLCMFDFSGSMTAFLDAFVKVGVDVPFVGFVGWQKHFNIASATLLDFNFACGSGATPPPVLANYVDAGGTVLGAADSDGILRLNMGPFAPDRLSVDVTDGDEHFDVAPGLNPGDVLVTAFGYTQTFTGINKIYAEGGHGSDIITLDAGLVATSELWGDFKNPAQAGDFGDDKIISGNGTTEIHGGGGNDTLTVRQAAGTVYGDAGKDKIFGGPNADTIDGGDDDDVIYGNGGDDMIHGGAGDDTIEGNPGDDTIYGDDGADQIMGGDGLDTVYGGPGYNVIRGEGGNDIVYGGDDGNLITGDEADIQTDGTVLQGPGGGTDTLNGGASSDAAYGQGGNDILNGNGGADYLEGGAGDDTMNGGTGDDHMIGGSSQPVAADGADTMHGNDGADILIGDDGTISSGGVVTLIGGAGEDLMYGDAGDDVMYGQGGNDYMEGNDGADTMHGGDGVDHMIGGSSVLTGTDGGDTMYGDAGNDVMLGDDGYFASVHLLGSAGNDSMYGGTGDDLMYGQAGDDYMEGNDGADALYGGDGVDHMIGGSSVLTGTDGNDDMFGEAGNDVMAGDDATISGGGAVTLLGSAGNDNMTGGLGDDALYGQAGADVMLGDNGTITIVPGSFQPETPAPLRTVVLASTVSDGNDTMYGGDDNDTLYGQGGDDHIYGEAGMDYMEGNSGADTMYGGTGEDDMIGGSSVAGTPDGNDFMDGGDNADAMLGDNGQIARRVQDDNTYERWPAPFADVIRDVTRYDDLDGIGVDDTMYGQGGDDILYGQRGNDTLSGGAGDDEVIGGLGNDTVNGNDGRDFLLGDQGYFIRVLNGDETPRINTNGSFHRDAVLEDVGTVTGMIPLDTTPLRTFDPLLAGELTKADMILVSGVFDAGGAKHINGDTNAWDTEALLLDLVPANNDIIDGGAGEDFVVGQRGNDSIQGGDGNDVLIGDQVAGVSSFPTDLPQVLQTLRLIDHDPGLPLTLDQLGSVIVPTVTMYPEELVNFTLPVLTSVTNANGAFADIVAASGLNRTDGRTMTPYVGIVPDVVHHQDVLPGNDTISGGAGADTIVGDNASFFAPQLSGLSEIDKAVAGADGQLFAALHALHELSLNYDLYEHQVLGVVDTHDIVVGQDTLSGNDGNDTIFGDNAVIASPFATGLPVSSSSLMTEALAFQTQVDDLRYVAVDLGFVVQEARLQVLNDLTADALTKNPGKVMPKVTDIHDPQYHVLTLDCDTIDTGSGNDTVYADETLVFTPLVNGQTYNKPTDILHLTTAQLNALQKALRLQGKGLDGQLASHVRANHASTANFRSRLPNSGDLALAAFPYEPSRFVGNDTINPDPGNTGDKAIEADIAVVTIPVFATAPATKAELAADARGARDVTRAIQGYVTRIATHKAGQNYFVKSAANFGDHRRAGKDSFTFSAANDSVTGGTGTNVIFGGGMFLTVPFDVASPGTLLNLGNFNVEMPILQDNRRAALDYPLNGQKLVKTFANDTIVANGADNSIFGGGGTNVVTPGSGTNRIHKVSGSVPDAVTTPVLQQFALTNLSPAIQGSILSLSAAVSPGTAQKAEGLFLALYL